MASLHAFTSLSKVLSACITVSQRSMDSPSMDSHAVLMVQNGLASVQYHSTLRSKIHGHNINERQRKAYMHMSTALLAITFSQNNDPPLGLV